MEQVKVTNVEDLKFRSLPLLAHFILHHHFDEYIHELTSQFERHGLPVPEKHIGNDIAHKFRKENKEILNYLSQGKIAEQVEEANHQWLNENYPFQGEVGGMEEIYLNLYVRKQALICFLPQYTTDINQGLAIIREIDRYALYAQTTASTYYLGLLHHRLKENTYFIQRITETSTGDLSDKESLINKLKQSEELYKQAESLASIGNWKWNLSNNSIEWTDEMYRIYGLEPQSQPISIERFKSFVHPDDREIIEQGIKDASGSKFQDYTFRIITDKGEVKTIRSIAQIGTNKDGESIAFGTEQDVTRQEELILKLQKREKLFEQAQEIALLGNWSWDVKSNRVSWSNEMYRIYGMDPQSEQITYEKYISFIHPDDQQMVSMHVNNAVNNKQPYEYYSRILLKNGKVKMLHSHGEIMVDEKNQIRSIHGTCQDVTERQQLISELQSSEQLYKQAQSLAHIGNWSWDVERTE